MWGWPWQILGMIHAVGRAGEPGEIFLSGKQSTILTIPRQPNFTKFEHNMTISVAMKHANFPVKGQFFPKRNQKCGNFFQRLATSGHHNSAMIKAKFHYASWFETGCIQVRSSFEPLCDQLEFGFYRST